MSYSFIAVIIKTTLIEHQINMKEPNTIATRRIGKISSDTESYHIIPRKAASNNRYKKLPALKGKYNEPYYDGLYRF